ncbi:MAG: DUF4382 domain-containing protein [Ginsengibacter sp.]
MKKSLIVLSLVVLSGTLFLTACKKDNNEKNSTTVNVRLTDQPADYAEVNVDIKEIRVKFTDESSDDGWQTLPTHAGIYNLLDYQNGKDTLLATGIVIANSIQQIRFILGSDNSIKVGTQVYPLTIPSGAESGLKLMINKKLSQSQENLIVDFDALLSIKQENGSYKLRPVLKLK